MDKYIVALVDEGWGVRFYRTNGDNLAVVRVEAKRGDITLLTDGVNAYVALSRVLYAASEHTPRLRGLW